MNKAHLLRELRTRLADDGHTIGSWIQIPHASIAEILGQAGYDWVAVDLEHGTVGPHQLPDLFRALELGGTLPFARLAQGHPKDCKQALDAGAAGIIVPSVESAEQLASVREACCWPPTGKRGVGFSRANLFGKHFEEYREFAQAPFLVAMIESRAAVSGLEEILAVPGLDAVLVGPYDLSASMGVTGEFASPEFVEAMKTILQKSDASGIPCGVHVVEPDSALLAVRRQDGYRFLAYSIDSVFLQKSCRAPVI